MDGIEGALRLPLGRQAVAAESPPEPEPRPPTQRLIAALEDGALEGLNLRARDVRALTRLTADASDRELAAAVAEFGDLRLPMLRVLQFLRNGDNEHARRQIHALKPEPQAGQEAVDAPQEQATTDAVEPSSPPVLSKKQKRAAQRAARQAQRESEEGSFQRLDSKALAALKQTLAAEDAEASRRANAEAVRRAEEAAAAQEAADRASTNFADLLERYGGEIPSEKEGD